MKINTIFKNIKGMEDCTFGDREFNKRIKKLIKEKKISPVARVSGDFSRLESKFEPPKFERETLCGMRLMKNSDLEEPLEGMYNVFAKYLEEGGIDIRERLWSFNPFNPYVEIGYAHSLNYIAVDNCARNNCLYMITVYTNFYEKVARYKLIIEGYWKSEVFD